MTDCAAIIVVQAVLALLLIISIARDIHLRFVRSSVQAEVVRGPNSRSRFGIAYGFGTVIVIQLITVSTAFDGHKVLLSLIDLSVLSYLCYFSSWFRNRLLCCMIAWEKRPER